MDPIDDYDSATPEFPFEGWSILQVWDYLNEYWAENARHEEG